MTTAFILLQAAAGGGLLGGLLPFVLIIVVMYLFFLRPQMKKQKEEAKFKDILTKGMRVVTHAGIHGKILELQDNTVILEVENARIKIEKTAVSKDLTATNYPEAKKTE